MPDLDYPFRLPEVMAFPSQEGLEPFSISYTEWIERYGFFIRDAWMPEKRRFGGRGWMILQEIPKRFLEYALRFNQETGAFYFDTVLFSAIKKSAKTAIAASVACWYAESCPDNSEIYVIANSREQAEGRVMRDIRFHCEKRGYRVLHDGVYLPNGTEIKSLSTAYASVAGSRHSLVLYDELWGATSEADRRLWEEMTSIPTIPHSLKFISTYAGFLGESDLLWDLYVSGVGKDEHEDGKGKRVPELSDLPVWINGRQITFWSHEPIAEWQKDPEYYRQQRASLRPEAYLRLHENRWVNPNYTFITPAMWEVAERYPMSGEMWSAHPLRANGIYVGVDTAPKHDRTAVVGVAYDPVHGAVGEVFHRIWTPRDGEILDYEVTVEAYLDEMRNKFRINAVIYDPAHMFQTARRLSNRGFRMVEWAQTPANMVKATMSLYEVLRLGRFATWRDDEAREHVFAAEAKNEPSGGFRLVKRNDKRAKPIDYAVALAMAVMLALEEGGIVIMDELKIDYPFTDNSSPSQIVDDRTHYNLIKDLPPELRTVEDEEYLAQWTII